MGDAECTLHNRRDCLDNRIGSYNNADVRVDEKMIILNPDSVAVTLLTIMGIALVVSFYLNSQPKRQEAKDVKHH